MRSCATSPLASGRWRSAGPPRAAGDAGWRSRRSATSPTSTRTTTSAAWTTGAGWTAWATGCGTPTHPICRCPSCSACCTLSRCRRLRRSATARRSSPTCAPPTTRCLTATKQAIDDLVVEHDVFWSRGQIGFTEFPPGEREQYPPSPQRLVRPHPGSQAQDAVSVRARLACRRLAGGRWPLAAVGPDRARDAAPVRLQPHLAGRRSGDLGQPRAPCIAAGRTMSSSLATCGVPPRWIPPRRSSRRHEPRTCREPAGRATKRCPKGGCSSMVERQLPKLHTRVRFPSPAPNHSNANCHWATLVQPTRRIWDAWQTGADPSHGVVTIPQE